MKTETTTQPPAAGEAAHTPTPWRIAETQGDGKRETKIRLIRAVNEGTEHGAVGFFVYGAEPGTIAEANAAFIVRACNAYESDQRKIKAMVEALKMQDTDIPYSRKLEWVFKGLKAAGGDMPSLKEIHALESRDALSEIAKWASEAAESERARVGANPDADAFVPSWLPELEAALNRAALALAKEGQ